MSVDTLVAWSAVGSAVAAALAWVGRWARRLTRTMDQFAEDWQGTAARPGVPERPGMMQRVGDLETVVADIKHELHPNSGLSLRDAVNRIETKLTDLHEQPR
ncbi:hypothetical protein ACPC54_18010 [Kitasatospora sp. NPDC094028]